MQYFLLTEEKIKRPIIFLIKSFLRLIKTLLKNLKRHKYIIVITRNTVLTKYYAHVSPFNEMICRNDEI